MRPPQFKISPFNSHFEGEFDASGMAWLAACSRGKADNIATLLGSDAADIESVLEVGCGTGAVLLELKRRGIGTNHRGVDLSDPADHTDPAVREAGLLLETYNGSALPFAEASIDLVYATHVLEHVAEEQPFLAELRRVAKRFVYIEVPCELTLKTSVASLQNTLDIGHLHPYTPQSFGLELCKANLAPSAFRLFDFTSEVHAWMSGRLRGEIKMLLRRTMLAISPHWASKLFCYHAGALCRIA